LDGRSLDCRANLGGFASHILVLCREVPWFEVHFEQHTSNRRAILRGAAPAHPCAHGIPYILYIISSGSAGLDLKRWHIRPFRAPHHAASAIALVGGGSKPRPGEISLAHHGVLFLDELPEFSRHVLEVLREPMETGCITISRACRQADFPARFQLVAAMNPCPCGYLGDVSGDCGCSSERVTAYRSKISGPLLDRIDLHVAVGRPSKEALRSTGPCGESSDIVASRVGQARELQLARSGVCNARLEATGLKNTVGLTGNAWRCWKPRSINSSCRRGPTNECCGLRGQSRILQMHNQ